MKHLLLALALSACSATLAHAQAFDPREYQNQVVGERTRVLVLGSPHLSGAPDTFDPAVLEPLLQRLEAFDPDVIAIEALPGESLDALWAYREIYPEVATSYGGRIFTMAAMTRHALQLDFAGAEAEVRRTLAEWPAEPRAAQRRRLAALFIASGDPNSALVQWWRLPLAERRAEDGVSNALMAELAAYETRRNENHMIGTRLAVRLGLERLYPIDDHASDDVMLTRGDDIEAFVQAPWFEALMADPAFTPLREASQNLRSARQALATYQMLNSPETGRIDANGQWLNMINRESPNSVGRTRVAEWETRNLRQVANIREAIAGNPGARVLVITGSAHKPWFDAYLAMMTDIEIVDASAILR